MYIDFEEFGSYKSYLGVNVIGEKKFKKEVVFCKMVDFVVGIGFKLVEVYRVKLRRRKKEVFIFIFSFFYESFDVE